MLRAPYLTSEGKHSTTHHALSPQPHVIICTSSSHQWYCTVFLVLQCHIKKHFCRKVTLSNILCYAMLCYAMLCYAMLCYAMLSYVMLCYAMLCYAMLCYTILYYTILYYTILYYTILYYTILYYTILYYTILYWTLISLTKTTNAKTIEFREFSLVKAKIIKKSSFLFWLLNMSIICEHDHGLDLRKCAESPVYQLFHYICLILDMNFRI